MTVKLLVDVKGFDKSTPSYKISTPSKTITTGVLENDKVNELIIEPTALSRIAYIFNVTTMSAYGKFNDPKTKIEVANNSRPEFSFLVDNETSSSTDQWRIWSNKDIELTVTKAGRSDEEEIQITFWNTDGIIDYKTYTPTPPKPKTKIVYNVTNADIKNQVDETTFTGERIELKAKDGFMFESVPTISYNDKIIEMETYKNDTSKTNYWVYLDEETFPENDITEMVINGVAVEKYVEVQYKLQFCSIDGEPVTKVFDSNPNFKVTLKCDDGYIFKSNPWLEYTTEPYNDFKKFDGVISEDKTTATVELKGNVFGELSSVIIQGTASVKPIETTIASNLATIYKVDNDKLKDISLIRFRQPNETFIEIMGGDINRKHIIDLASYIISLKHFFIDIPATQEENVKIGFIQTDIATPVVPYDSLTLDLGNIEIKGKQENINDYSNTVVSVYLAFIGLVTLDSVLTVNKTINVRYEVNLYNGDCQVFLTNNDNIVVYMGSCNISADIPYIYDYDRNVNNQLNFFSSMNFMQDLESYVLVRNKIPVHSSLNLTLDNKETIIGNEKGLNYFTDFQIEFIADKQEKEELKNIIENGIIL